MTTSTRERALAALFAIVDAEPWFRTRERNSVFALDHVEHADFPAVVMVDGGDVAFPRTNAALTTSAAVYFWVGIRPDINAPLPAQINEARHKLLARLSAWIDGSALVTDDLAVALRYVNMSDPDIDDDGAPLASFSIEMRLEIAEPEFSTLSF